MQERCRDIVLQLDDGKSQRGYGKHFRAVHRAVPLELAGRCHAEFVREMPSLVMVLAVLVLIKCQSICAVLVVVNTEFALLAKLKVAGARASLQVFSDQAGQKRRLRKES